MDTSAATKSQQGHEHTGVFGDLPEPLYRLRLSVLHNNKGHHDCPSQMFVRAHSQYPFDRRISSASCQLANITPNQAFPSVQSLGRASAKINDVLGGAFSTYSIEKRGIDAIGEVTGDGEMENVEDGRTENVMIKFDSQTADETWKEFLTRLHNLESGWTKDV